jgi:ornithine cyclodeaminase
MRVLDDRDVARLLDPETAVAAARRALADAYLGRLAAPPRERVELGDHGFVFTAGGYASGPVGFRAYGLWPGRSDQAVLVWNGGGRLAGVVVGAELGVRRTGALGAVAVDVLARADARGVGIVGSGAQAWSQLWAITAVRAVERVAVYSPTPEHRSRFAERACAELRLDAHAVDDAESAVLGADIVVLATRATAPVIQPGWIAPGVHISTVGPKAALAHETPPAIAETAAVVASDAPAQATGYGEPFFTARPLEHVGRFVARRVPARRGEQDVTLYCSTGLAGSEVVIADALLRAAR